MDCKQITYAKPEKQGAFYYAPMSYGKATPIHIQTPRMKLKVSGEDILKKTTPMIDAEMLVDDYTYYDLKLAIDERNITETFKHNEEWFNKKIPLELIDDMYKRCTKPVKKGGKPLFCYKIPMLKGVVQCPIFDQHQNRRDIKDLVEGSEIILVVHIRGLKFLKQHYYCDMYVSQMKVFVPQKQKYAVLDDCVITDDTHPVDVLDETVVSDIKTKTQQIQTAIDEKRSEIQVKKTEIEEKRTEIQGKQNEIEENNRAIQENESFIQTLSTDISELTLKLEGFA